MEYKLKLLRLINFSRMRSSAKGGQVCQNGTL